MTMTRIQPKFKGTVTKGRVVLEDRYSYIRQLARMEGKVVEVVVGPWKKARTDAQNAYYFGVVIGLLSEETGYTQDEMHESMKMMFLRVPGEGKRPDRVRSTKDLTTAEFSEYIENIKRWASMKMNVYIPDAGDVARMV